MLKVAIQTKLGKAEMAPEQLKWLETGRAKSTYTFSVKFTSEQRVGTRRMYHLISLRTSAFHPVSIVFSHSPNYAVALLLSLVADSSFFSSKPLATKAKTNIKNFAVQGINRRAAKCVISI